MNMFDLSNKRALVTGGTRGLGRGMAEALVEFGAKVVITGTSDKVIDVAKEIGAVAGIKCDFLNDQAESVYNQAKDVLGGSIDILVNNAAIGVGGSIAEIPMAKVRQCFEVNVFGTFTVVQRVLKRMMQKGEGKIINISSLAGLIPMKFLGVYGASKASVRLLTRTLRKELKIINKNIKIVLIEPGLYKTGFNQVMLENKYDWMRTKSYFSEELKIIKKCENKLFNLLEKRNLNSIAKKIVKAITCDNPSPIYRAPCLYAIFVKLYNFFTN